jgi:hypothetical protein
LTLEARNAPGSLLGELLAAAAANWLLPVNPPPPAAGDRPADLSVTAANPPAARPSAGVGLLPRPEPAPDGDGPADAAPAVSVGAGPSMDDDLFFLAAPSKPVSIPTNAAVVPGMAPPPAGGSGSAPTGPVGSGANTAGASTGSAAAGAGATFLVPASALATPRPANATPSDAGQTAPTQAGVDSTNTSSPGMTANFEYVADLPPNAAPVADDDTATVTEDGSVVIDVLANDTDTDGDTIWIDSFDWQPANGTVTETDDGKLKYTPFADYDDRPYQSGETFTYTVTDGRDVSAPATVTVSFNPVNDAPIAFNDAVAFYNYGYGNPTQYWPPDYDTGSVLANDFDYEVQAEGRSFAGVAAVDTTGTVGTITMNMTDGTFTWFGPPTFFGQSSFRYKAADDQGGVSDWATVQLWVNPPPGSPPPPVTATADTVAVGADPRTFDVTGNDSGGSVAILAAPPGVGVTGFGFDGTASYAPRGGVAVGGQLSYLLFGPDGVATATATADMVVPNLDIYNGQGGAVVRDQDETTIGAFTVVNKNDTDGDAKVDNADDQGVHAADGVGVSEMDLMRLRVNKPTGFGANDTVTVAVTHGAARFFGTNLRENNFGQTLTLNAASFVVNGQPVQSLDYWVEIYDTSNTLRDIEITMTYQGQPVKVNATGIWANFNNTTDFHANGEKRPGLNADNLTYLKFWDRWVSNVTGFQLGQPPMMTSNIDPVTGLPGFTVSLRNMAEFAFTVLPAGVEKEMGDNIQFDVSRTIEARRWAQLTGQPIDNGTQFATFPAFREAANDDNKNIEEDNEPRNQQIYSLDQPGLGFSITPAEKAAGDYSGGYARLVQHMNAQEFVRVKLDGSAFHNPSGNGVKGSRASELVNWRSWQDWQWDVTTKTWVRSVNTPQYVFNEIALGDPRPL